MKNINNYFYGLFKKNTWLKTGEISAKTINIARSKLKKKFPTFNVKVVKNYGF